MRDLPGLQIISIYTLQLISNILHIKVKPYESKIDNTVEFINDSLYTVSIIFYMIASDFTFELSKK